MARGGSALVAGSTADLVRHELPPPLSLVRVGLLPLRDIPEPEEAFELVDARAEAERNQTGDAADAEPTELARRVVPVGPSCRSRCACRARPSQDARTRWRTCWRRSGRPAGASAAWCSSAATLASAREADRRARPARPPRRGDRRVRPGRPRAGAAVSHLRRRVLRRGRPAPAEPLLDGYVDAFGGELSRIVPVLARRIPWLPAPAAGDPGTERHRLFDAARPARAPGHRRSGPADPRRPARRRSRRPPHPLPARRGGQAARRHRGDLPQLGEVEADSDLGRLLTHARRAKHVTMTVLPGLRAGDLTGLVGELSLTAATATSSPPAERGDGRQPAVHHRAAAHPRRRAAARGRDGAAHHRYRPRRHRPPRRAARSGGRRGADHGGDRRARVRPLARGPALGAEEDGVLVSFERPSLPTSSSTAPRPAPSSSPTAWSPTCSKARSRPRAGRGPTGGGRCDRGAVGHRRRHVHRDRGRPPPRGDRTARRRPAHRRGGPAGR